MLIESLFPAFPETDFPLRGRSTGKLTVLAGRTVRESSGAAERPTEEELEKLLNELGIGDVKVHVNKMNNANLIGTAIAALS